MPQCFVHDITINIKGAKQCSLERLEVGKVVTRYKPTMALTVPILSWVRLSCIMQWVEVKVKVHLSWCVSLETNIKFN